MKEYHEVMSTIREFMAEGRSCCRHRDRRRDGRPAAGDEAATGWGAAGRSPSVRRRWRWSNPRRSQRTGTDNLGVRQHINYEDLDQPAVVRRSRGRRDAGLRFGRDSAFWKQAD
jgi:hypothetical protein